MTARLGEAARPPMGEVTIGPKPDDESEEPAARKGRLGSILVGRSGNWLRVQLYCSTVYRYNCGNNIVQSGNKVSN